MSDDTWIDFDGDGTADEHTSETLEDGSTEYTHTDDEGNVDAVAVDIDGDGVIDYMDVDSDGDGNLDTTLFDEDGDGYMDSEIAWEEETSSEDESAAPAEDSEGDSPEDILDDINPFGSN